MTYNFPALMINSVITQIFCEEGRECGHDFLTLCITTADGEDKIVTISSTNPDHYLQAYGDFGNIIDQRITSVWVEEAITDVHSLRKTFTLAAKGTQSPVIFDFMGKREPGDAIEIEVSDASDATSSVPGCGSFLYV